MVIGKVYGKLTVLDIKRENNRTWYYCKCQCGNEKWIRADCIGEGKTISCGCYNKENNLIKAKDITNMQFGRLKAIAPTDKRDKNNGSVIWECKCECGSICYIAEYRLTSKEVKSCGCLGKENSQDNIKKAIDTHLKENIVEGTNLQVITRNKPIKTNTSGVTGVRWDKSREKWYVSITFKGKIYFLGRYTDKEEAIKVRKEAEEKIFGEFLKIINQDI